LRDADHEAHSASEGVGGGVGNGTQLRMLHGDSLEVAE
jgi:hypothetical protein